MEELASFICAHAHHAYWIIFLLLLLTGLGLPISEDLLVISGGAIASTCIAHQTGTLLIWILAGVYLSAWEAYWIGRLLGPKLYDIRFFKHLVTQERVDTLRTYYARFGIWTFIVARFFPGGVRNGLFMSSGLTKMPFPLFILRDSLAGLISCSTFFYLGYHFGNQLDVVIEHFNRYTKEILASLAILLIAFLFFYWYRRIIK